LQQISSRSLTQLWVGVAACVLAAGGVAYATLPAAVKVDTIKPGSGPVFTKDDVALINYKGTLPDGKVFDEGKQAVMVPGEIIPGFTRALEKMQAGGKYHVVIPPSLGYGDKQVGPIPPNTTLAFDIDLLDFKSRADVEAQQRLMQQMQQMQGAGGPAPAGPGGAGMPPPPGAEVMPTHP
jgi:FKBP-type peptidyl-prolyl cis-trans isomerase FkpA